MNFTAATTYIAAYKVNYPIGFNHFNGQDNDPNSDLNKKDKLAIIHHRRPNRKITIAFPCHWGNVDVATLILREPRLTPYQSVLDELFPPRVNATVYMHTGVYQGMTLPFKRFTTDYVYISGRKRTTAKRYSVIDRNDRIVDTPTRRRTLLRCIWYPGNSPDS